MPDLFTPYSLKDVALRSLIVMSPMTMYRSRDGLMSDFHVMLLGSRGRRFRPGVSGAAGRHPRRPHQRQLRWHLDDTQIDRASGDKAALQSTLKRTHELLAEGKL